MTCAQTGQCRLGSHTYAWPCVYAPGARPPAPPPSEPHVTHEWDDAVGGTSCCGRHLATDHGNIACDVVGAVPADPDDSLVRRVATALGDAVTAGKTQQTWLSRRDLRALAAVAVEEARARPGSFSVNA
jgi:hypothetical protein